MGSVNYEKYFTTDDGRNTDTKFPVSREWNYSDKAANSVEAPSPDPDPEVHYGDNRDKMNAEQRARYDELISEGYIYGTDFTVNGSGAIVFL